MKRILLAGLLFLPACTVVGPGQRGVRISLGTVSEDAKQPGAYLWLPFILGMTKFDVQIQKSDIETSAASKDMQEVTTRIAINWSITPDKAVNMVKEIGDEEDVLKRIIIPNASEVLKAAMSKRNAEEQLTKRMELKTEIDKELAARLAPYGVTIHGVSIINFKFSEQFTQAIESKQIAEQAAKQAEYDAQKAIQQAKANVNLARGQAEAQALLKTTLTKEMLEKMAIEKWDGQLPQVTSGAMPFINLKQSKSAE